MAINIGAAQDEQAGRLEAPGVSHTSEREFDVSCFDFLLCKQSELVIVEGPSGDQVWLRRHKACEWVAHKLNLLRKVDLQLSILRDIVSKVEIDRVDRSFVKVAVVVGLSVLAEREGDASRLGDEIGFKGTIVNIVVDSRGLFSHLGLDGEWTSILDSFLVQSSTDAEFQSGPLRHVVDIRMGNTVADSRA